MTTSDQPMEHVLIIEDDEHISGLLQFIIERHGLRTRLASDGRAASNAISEMSPPRLVLLDLMLPYHDGFELMQMIRRQPGWSEVPIILLTAKNVERDIVRAFDAGANDYIVKPFHPAELMARLKRFVQVAT